MKVLIAVLSCLKNRDRVNSQRSTWADKDRYEVENNQYDLQYFIGRNDMKDKAELVRYTAEEGVIEDEMWKYPFGGETIIALDADDGYDGLPEKVREVCKYALAKGYDGLFRADDDIFLRPERLFIPDADYAGRVRGPAMGLPAPYCSGFCYWLSRKAMQAIVDTPFKCQAEDCMVGNILLQHGIEPLDLGDQIVVVKSKKCAISGHEGPRKGNVVIASCEYEPDEMQVAHEEFLKAESIPYPRISDEDPDLSRVDILIKTFLRDGMLYRAVGGIKDFLPSARMVIVDDGDSNHPKTTFYSRLKWAGHVVKLMPFDAGFGEKSNAAIPLYKREYVLIASDDFNFTEEVAEGVRKLVRALDLMPEYAVMSGRVNGNPYEFFLEQDGTTIREVPATKTVTGVIPCDLTVNFSLIRREVFDKVRWDGGDVKIGGGEHAAYFISLKEAGFKVACIPSVNVNEIGYFVGCQDPRYPGYRARARQSGRPCLKRLGVDYYHCFGHKEPEVC